MKRIVYLMLALALLMGILPAAGCSKNEEDIFGLDDSAKVELTVAGGLENFEALEEVIVAFEDKYPNCKITYEYINEYSKNIRLRMENPSERPSLFLSQSSYFKGEDSMAEYAVDLSEDKESGVDLSGVKPIILSSQKTQEALYCIPLALNARGMVVNKTLLTRYSLEVPENWVQFIYSCEKLKSEGFIPIQGYNDNALMCLFYPAIAVSLVNDPEGASKIKSMDSFEKGSDKYISEYFEKALYLTQKGYIDYDENSLLTDSYESTILNFLQGDVAFTPCTAEMVSGIKKRESKSAAFTSSPFEYEFFASPVGESSMCYWEVWQCLSVTKDCENEAWARAFANFIAKEENLQTLAMVKGLPCAGKSPSADAKYRSLYVLEDKYTAESKQFQIAFYSCINNTLKRICYKKDDEATLKTPGEISEKYEIEMEKKRK
ncbi:MAG: carbohydrate ABC transporter substrate-binding protein [Eubacteriaceae bacterium]|nr:carbohydrate ABC transporter substrate-binding protein [Eubacteriaceae bacterium]